MKKIRILHHSNQLGLGGTEKEIQIFCKYFDREKFEFHVMAPESPISLNRRVLDLARALLGSARARSRKEQNKYALSRVDEFKKILGPQNLHLYTPKNFESILRKIAPHILHVHHSGEFVPPLNQPRLLKTVPLLFTVNVFGFKDSTCQDLIHKILFPSQWLMESVGWTKGDARCDVLYCPIEKPLTKENLRGELGIGENIFVLGRVGRNADDIHDSISLRAYKEIETDATLFLVMAPPPRMVKEAKELGIKNIRYLEPTVDDLFLSRFYNTIDVLAHARADGETFGCVIAEAMIHGKPVISHYSNQRNAQAELLQEGCGFVVEQGNWKKYSERIKLLQEDKQLRYSMGNCAKKRALENFEASVVTKRLESFYMDKLGTEPYLPNK